MELDCTQLPPTVPVPPRRQLAVCHIGAFTSNRGITALGPARLHQTIFKYEKDKEVGGALGRHRKAKWVKEAFEPWLCVCACVGVRMLGEGLPAS